MPPSPDDPLYKKIRGLNDLLWEDHANRTAVRQWLGNFRGDSAPAALEQRHALYLLSKFLYFGHIQVRELLRAMFQDLVRHPLTVRAREHAVDRNDFDAIHQGFVEELSRTRFLGLGNPAESGTHILYDFRLANQLPLDLFVSLHELFTGALDDAQTAWALPDVDRVIFIDDFCGTGHQATKMSRIILPVMRNVASRIDIDLEVSYLTLLGTTTGLTHIRTAGLFDRVESVSELDPTYRVFGDDSQFYRDPPEGLTKMDAERIARHYGGLLKPGDPVGYEDSQLLLGFHHNVPNNTLPILSQDGPSWHAIFPRVEKS